MPVQIGAKPVSFGNPIGLLSDCHRRIEMFLGSLQEVAKANGRLLSSEERCGLEKALQYFREAAPKHTADEEESLFPRLRRTEGSEVRETLEQCARLEQDHRAADALHAKVEELGGEWLRQGSLAEPQACEFRSSVTRLAEIYREHIKFEDRVLFPLADKLLSSRQKTEISQEIAGRRLPVQH